MADDEATAHKQDKDAELCELSQAPSNVDLLTFKPKADEESKKNKKGKKLLHFLKRQNDRKDVTDDVMSRSRPPAAFAGQESNEPLYGEAQPKVSQYLTFQNDHKNKTKWNFSKTPVSFQTLPNQSEMDTNDERLSDHGPDVVVAEGNLGRKISLRNFSPTPETDKHSKPVEVGFKPGKRAAISDRRECKSSLARHDNVKAVVLSDKSLSMSPNQNCAFTPRPEPERDEGDLTSVKKAISSTLRIPTITFKGKQLFLLLSVYILCSNQLQSYRYSYNYQEAQSVRVTRI